MTPHVETDLWRKPGVPHRGWQCVGVEDLRSDGQPPDETDYATCQMCGHEQIRFVHFMTHPEFDGTVEAGCICAEKMSGDYVTPRLQEARLKRKAARRAKWIARKWRRSAKGNEYLNLDGFNLVVFPAKFRPGQWCFGIDGDFSQTTYPTLAEAKLALFEEYWRRIDGE